MGTKVLGKMTKSVKLKSFIICNQLDSLMINIDLTRALCNKNKIAGFLFWSSRRKPIRQVNQKNKEKHHDHRQGAQKLRNIQKQKKHSWNLVKHRGDSWTFITIVENSWKFMGYLQRFEGLFYLRCNITGRFAGEAIPRKRPVPCGLGRLCGARNIIVCH